MDERKRDAQVIAHMPVMTVEQFRERLARIDELGKKHGADWKLEMSLRTNVARYQMELRIEAVCAS